MPDMQDLVPACLRMIADAYAWRQERYLQQFLEDLAKAKCESPIELQLATAFYALVTAQTWTFSRDSSYGEVAISVHTSSLEEALAIGFARSTLAIPGSTISQFEVICPQVHLGDYRADLVFIRHTYGVHETALYEIIETAGPLVVECDGFDYHDRTREQVVRDKRRDRALQTLGYPTLRFAGTEIFNDPLRCVTEIDNYLRKHKRPLGPLGESTPPPAPPAGSDPETPISRPQG